jgi:cytochrome c553
MNDRKLFTLAAAAALLAAGLGAAHAPAARADALLDRGAYLVNGVGMCGDCHGAKLQGDTLGFLAPKLPLAYKSPKIAGLPMFKTDAEAVTFFESGKTPSGKPALPPMPHYRLNAGDAHALVAYLRSLATKN